MRNPLKGRTISVSTNQFKNYRQQTSKSVNSFYLFMLGFYGFLLALLSFFFYDNIKTHGNDFQNQRNSLIDIFLTSSEIKYFVYNGANNY